MQEVFAAMRHIASSDRSSRTKDRGNALNKFFGKFKASSSSFDSDADYRLRLAETTQSMIAVPAPMRTSSSSAHEGREDR